jgi:putative FmdB family regulatory protein
MPVYEYECGSCGGRFDATQKFSDSALTVCSLCNKEGKVRKVLSIPSFVLKGTGWYATDYAAKPEKSDAAASEKPCADAKPAAGCASGACPGGCAAKG